eukprot:7006163-Lingulodinium_polyedra.AAC.1
MMPEQTVLFACQHESSCTSTCNDVPVPIEQADVDSASMIEEDEFGQYVELCCADEMPSIILQEDQHQQMQDDEVATLRVYVTDAAKRA